MMRLCVYEMSKSVVGIPNVLAVHHYDKNTSEKKLKRRNSLFWSLVSEALVPDWLVLLVLVLWLGKPSWSGVCGRTNLLTFWETGSQYLLQRHNTNN